MSWSATSIAPVLRSEARARDRLSGCNPRKLATSYLAACRFTSEAAPAAPSRNEATRTTAERCP